MRSISHVTTAEPSWEKLCSECNQQIKMSIFFLLITCILIAQRLLTRFHLPRTQKHSETCPSWWRKMSYSTFSPGTLELSLVDECHHKKESAYHIPHVHFDSCQSYRLEQSADSRLLTAAVTTQCSSRATHTCTLWCNKTSNIRVSHKFIIIVKVLGS